MSALADLQARFLAAILDARGEVVAEVRGTPSFDPATRMAVYANAYRRRLAEALAATFERTALLLGEARFDALALAYVATHASTGRCLVRYGLGFPDWLHDSTPAQLDTGAIPPAVLSGVARLDIGLRRAFDAADAEPLHRDALLALPVEAWPELRLRPVPALATARIDARAIPLWHHAAPGAPDEPTDAAGDASGEVVVAFWRRDGQSLFRSLAAEEAWLLRRLLTGMALAEACAGDGRDDPAGGGPIPPDVAAPALLRWADEGWLAASVP